MNHDLYVNKRWRKLRARVLRKAKYQCQWAKRYDKRLEATEVHHIYPVEDYPEYAFCKWNLIALSKHWHNAMHDRKTNKLTALGKELMRRTKPPEKQSPPAV